MDNLNRAVEVANLAVKATPQDHPDRAARLNNLGNWLSIRFERTDSVDDLNRAVEVADLAVKATLQDHPDRATTLSNLGISLGTRFERKGSMDDLNRAVEVTDLAVKATPQDHLDRARRLNNLGIWLGRRFERTDSMNDLNRAVKVADLAVKSTPQDYPDRACWLNNLGMWLGRRFERTDSMNDLNRAVEVADLAVKAIPQDHPDRANILSNLGISLGTRFERKGSMDDLNRAVEVANLAVKATPQDHPDRARRLNNLGNSLGRRFERTDSMDDLNRAVEVADLAVKATPQDHPDRAIMLNNHGIWLGRRFERMDSVDDLNRAVEVTDLAVKATPQDHPDRAARLSNLGNLLGKQFRRKGLKDDLNRAVKVTGLAVKSTPHDHPDRAARLNNLGNWLSMRFEQTDSVDDLNRAVEVADLAVKATPQDHPDRATTLSNLGFSLGKRFERKGSMDDLNRAVEVTDLAVKATPQDHPDRAHWLDNLGNSLGRRFERTGSMDDLNRAVEVADLAVKATPQDHPDQARKLNNLGNSLGRRFKRKGLIDDLNRAIEVADLAVKATPQNHPDQAAILNNFGNWLSMGFERTGIIDDLNRAIEVADLAIKATPQDHPDRARWLNNLGNWLSMRFERTDSIEDLNRAVEVANLAVKATPQDHPDRAGWLSNLGNSLRARFELTGSMDDLERSLSLFREGWDCHTSPPSIRIRLARKVATYLASQSYWDESSTLLEDAVRLLPTVSPRSLQHTDKQHMLADFAGIASMAAATALNAGKEAHHALKLLELGRGIIAGLLLEMRTDASDLERQHPELAKEFVSLRDELDSLAGGTAHLTTLENAPSMESKVKRLLEAEKRLPVVLKEIRSKQGFQNFLLPPTLDDLKTAADPGPIVFINVSSYRCDAFIMRQNCPVKALELANLRLKDIERNTKSLRTANQYRMQKTMEWLWDVAARPILEELGFEEPPSDENWPRIWWILTGQLSQLPFHAAGRHFKDSKDTVLDRVISSYSSSIKVLIHGRQHRGRNLSQKALENALLVTVPGSGLPFALDEVAMLEDLCPTLELHPVKPAPQRDEILAHLRSCKIFHFASHGRSNPLEPSESCLVLGGENNSVTVADLRDCRLQENSPFLAYLSACSTKVNAAERLIDEEIHLVSACQLAGFRHVVGTLWQVSDRYCVNVAKVLYETIRDEGMTDNAVCLGLHRAIKALRDKVVATTETKEESYAAGNGKVNEDETGRREAVIEQNDSQSDAKLASVRDMNVDNNMTRVAEGRMGQSVYQIMHDKTDNTVDTGREQQKGVEKPDGGDVDPRQSHWGVPCGSSQLAGPLLWAAYIHVGV